MASALMNMMVDEEKKSGRKVVRPTKTVRKMSPGEAEAAKVAEARQSKFTPEQLAAYTKRAEEAATQEKPLVDVGNLENSFADNLPIRDVRPEKSGIFAPNLQTAVGGQGTPKTAAGDITSAFASRYGAKQPGSIDIPVTRTPDEEEQYRAAQNRMATPEAGQFGDELEQATAARQQTAEPAPAPSFGQWMGKGTRPAQTAAPEPAPLGNQNLLDDQGNLRTAVDFFDKPFTQGEKKFGTAKDFLPDAAPKQQFETRTNPEAGRPASNQYSLDLNSDSLMSSFKGNEIPTMTMVGKLRSAITSGVSLPEAARRVYNGATDADKNGPMFKVLEAYNNLQGNARTDTQKRLLNDGLAAVSDYFDRGSKAGSKHSVETFNDAIDIFKLAGDPDYRASDVYEASPALMSAMSSDPNSVFATKFGNAKDRSERASTMRFDEVYTGINKVLNKVSTNALTGMSRGNSPAFQAARDVASAVLGPLTISKPDNVSSVDWTGSNSVRSQIVDSIYLDVADVYERRNMSRAFNFNEAMGNDVVARRFGGQFDIKATLTQVTNPNFAGREADYAKDVSAAMVDKNNNKNVDGAKKLSSYYTTEALKMIFGDTGIEGYDSGRVVGVSTGAGSDLVSSMRASEQRMIEAELKRDVAPLRTNMTPHQLIGALFAEQGVPSSLFTLATPRVAKTEQMQFGLAPDGKTTNFKLNSHPDSVLQVTSKSGSPISFDDRKYILKMQALLEGAENPQTLMKQLQTDARFKELSKRNTFTLGQTKNLTIAQDSYADMTRGSRVVSSSQGSLDKMADIVSDVRQMLRIPADDDGTLYVDKTSAEMYDTAKAIQTRLKSSLDSYQKNGDEYILASDKVNADFPSVLTPDQYQSLRGALSSMDSLISSADDIRAKVGGTGVSTGFQLKADGSPDFMRPRQVTGSSRLDQTLDMLDHWSQGGRDMDFKKLFSGVNLVEGARQSTRSSVQLLPVDVNWRTINDKTLIKSYDVDSKTGTANVAQYQKVDGKWVPVIGENGKPRTMAVRTNQQTERAGVSTVLTQTASQGRYGLTPNYVVSSFNQFHNELNKAFKEFPDAADSFAKYVMFTGNEDVIKQIKETGITQQELQRIVVGMNRRQGSALHSILEIARGRDFKPESRAPGTMNGTSGPRSSESRLERDVINKVDAGDRRAAEDVVIQNNKTKIQSAFATARNIYLQEGAGDDKESQIQRIVKTVLEDRTSDADITPELRPAFEEAVRNQVTSLVYEDKNSSRARMQFMDSVYGYAEKVVSEQAAKGEVSAAPSLSGAGVNMGEGRGKAADRTQSRKNLVTTSITDAINLMGFGADSKARKSLRAAKSPFTDGVLLALDNYDKATTPAAKQDAVADLVKRIATAKNNGITMPDSIDGVVTAGSDKQQLNINVEELNMSPAQRRKLDIIRKRNTVRALKLRSGSTEPTPEPPATPAPARSNSQPRVATVDVTKMSSSEISDATKKVIRTIKTVTSDLTNAREALQILRKGKPTKSKMNEHVEKIADTEKEIRTLELQLEGENTKKADYVKAISAAKIKEEQEAIKSARQQGTRQRVKINNALGFSIANDKVNPGWLDVLDSANSVFNRNGKVMTKADAVKVLVAAGLKENVAQALLVEVDPSKKESAGFNRNQLDKKYSITAPERAKFMAAGTRFANGLFKNDADLAKQRANFKPGAQTPVTTQQPILPAVKPKPLSRAQVLAGKMRSGSGKTLSTFATLLGIGTETLKNIPQGDKK
jgi:hypothetical protein